MTVLFEIGKSLIIMVALSIRTEYYISISVRKIAEGAILIMLIAKTKKRRGKFLTYGVPTLVIAITLIMSSLGVSSYYQVSASPPAVPSDEQICGTGAGSSVLNSPYTYTGGATSFTSGEYGLPTFGTSRTDTATITAGSSTVSDASITAADQGKVVQGYGIPDNATAANVISGTSFQISIGGIIRNAKSSATESISVATSDYPNATAGVIVQPGTIGAGGTALPSSLSLNTIYYFIPSSTPYYYLSNIWVRSGDVFIGGYANGNRSILDGQNAHSFNNMDISDVTRDVTIRYLTLQHFASTLGNAFMNINRSRGWVLSNDNISNNMAKNSSTVGINSGAGYVGNFGSETIITHNCFERDGEGVFNIQPDNPSDPASDIAINYNEFGYNGFADYPDPCGCASGSGKFNETVNLSYTHNYEHDGASKGLWGDFNNAGADIENNYLANNYDAALWYEASYNANISNNVITNNGWAADGPFPACPWNTSHSCTAGSGPLSEGPGGVPYAAISTSDSGGNGVVSSDYNGISSGCPSGYTDGCLLVQNNDFVNNWSPLLTYQDDGRFSGGTVINQSGSPLQVINTTYYQNFAQWQDNNASVTSGATTISSNDAGFRFFYDPQNQSIFVNTVSKPNCSSTPCSGTSASPGSVGTYANPVTDNIPYGGFSGTITSIPLNYPLPHPLQDGTTIMVTEPAADGTTSQLFTVQTSDGGPVLASSQSIPVVSATTVIAFPLGSSVTSAVDVSMLTSAHPGTINVFSTTGFSPSGGTLQLATTSGTATATYTGVVSGPGGLAQLTGVQAAAGTPLGSALYSQSPIVSGDGTAPLYAYGNGIPTTNGGTEGDPVTCTSATSCTLSVAASSTANGQVVISSAGGCGLFDLFGSTAGATSGLPAAKYFDNCMIGGERNILVSGNTFSTDSDAIGCVAGGNCAISGSIAFANGTQGTWWNFYNSYYPAHVALASGGLNNIWKDNTYSFTGSGGVGSGDALTLFAGSQSTAATPISTWTTADGQDVGSNFLPYIAITGLATGRSVHGASAQIMATSSSPVGNTIDSTAFKVNGMTVSTTATSPYNYNFDTLGYPNGNYTLDVQSTDSTNLSNTASVSVTVDNGDFNNDGKVNTSDLDIMAANWGKPDFNYADGNITGQNTINISDLAVMAANWGWSK